MKLAKSTAAAAAAAASRISLAFAADEGGRARENATQSEISLQSGVSDGPRVRKDKIKDIFSWDTFRNSLRNFAIKDTQDIV